MKPSRKTTAFSLVEVTLAIGVASFCLLAVVALLPTGTKVSYQASQETIAANILAAVVADMRATPAIATTSTQFGFDFSNHTYRFLQPSGTSSTTLTANSTHRVDVYPIASSGATMATLLVTWPAAASPGATPNPNATGSSQTFAAITRN